MQHMNLINDEKVLINRLACTEYDCWGLY
jgi:hypothetical protein